MSQLPTRLQEIVEDFNFCEGEEKLEYLLEFAENLPPLPEWLDGRQAEMDEVHECMTPVFIYPESNEGKVFFHFDIPPEAPTVRGFGAILQQGFDWTTPNEVLSVSNEFYLEMGLHQVLSGQRLHGISAILAHMKSLVQMG